MAHCAGNCRQGRDRCTSPRKCGAYSYTDGGNYHAEYAENSYSHLRDSASPLPVNFAGVEPDELDEQRDYAKAIVRAALFLVIAGCVAAVIFN